MFGMRRYRLFLVVAALSAATIYYLSRSGSWSLDDLEQLGQPNHRYDIPERPPVQDHIVEAPQPRPVPPPVSQDEDVPAVEDADTRVGERIVPVPVPTTTSKTSTTTPVRSRPTPTRPTGDEVLPKQPVVEQPEEGYGRYEVTSSDSAKARWKKPKAQYPLRAQDMIKLPSGAPQKLPKIQAAFSPETASSKQDRINKLNVIKESFRHAWNGYKTHGLPHDEVKPLSKSFADPFMGWGATLVDTLDTLWIMGLKQEFEDALVEVEKIDFKTSPRPDIPLFETVIRYLGGLLAAYDISASKYPMLLEKAEELADILMGAFDTPNRMPVTFYHWAPSKMSEPHRAGSHVTMAELGSLSVEMTRLAQITGNHEYYDAVARIVNELEMWQSNTLMPGLWPLKLDASGCKQALKASEKNAEDNKGMTETAGDKYPNGEEPAIMLNAGSLKTHTEPDADEDLVKRDMPLDDNDDEEDEEDEDLATSSKRISLSRQPSQKVLTEECIPQGLAPEKDAKTHTYGIGGQADSTYEYLPKMHALLRGRNKQYETMYLDSMTTIRNELLFRPMVKEKDRRILFAARREFRPKAKEVKKREETVYEVTHLSCFLGGMVGLGSKLFGIQDDLQLATELTDGCVWAYESMPTGVMPESASVVPCPSLDVCVWNETRWHEALDPRRDERFEAVRTWNKNQKAIYEKSKKQAMLEATTDKDEASTAEQRADRTRIKNDDLNVKRDAPITSAGKPSKTEPDLEFDEDIDAETEPPPVSSAISFTPKTALSHEKYVRARIQEERLPPSYTKIVDPHYGLRPEAIESVFHMYRITGDERWRKKGWQMFEAVQAATQTEIANAVVKDVTSVLGELGDTMESFWLAETLKYFYLLFSEPEVVSLDEWVLNTEAHPMKVEK
ncbi:hypothetical protein H2198_003161 [Neophaeococcomyces mojaviensis]|uniref:Uncharacterized protein n=1 Tax=Neophaeococcomyces mojaviensis TaxID=3383035 RepID=A0ACC3AC84_9EURO|nr:hypothetical protein H2198_003161 [Knufia sp. JES_112]